MTNTHKPQVRLAIGGKFRIVGMIAAILLSGAVVTASPASADTDQTLTVVGTSDVFDSHLVQSVIKPGFEAAYKASTGSDISLNYVSKGTGAAIAYAEAGTASAMIVHAASLENQFVGDGYSAEQYGRAVFFGDYVLLGPAGDPAGVLNGAKNDITTAFEKIAAAGVNHTARFVSRGGTPGTTVQEHAIWALTKQDNPANPQCTVSTANGGGTAPSTTAGSCPTTDTNPSWYKTTGATQGPNVLNADACNSYTSDGDPSTNDCYVFTDRGTFQYLRSTNAISNLGIVTRENSPDARGGATELVNSFHAYAVSAGKFADNPNVRINSAAATFFLNWLTSPAGQQQVGQFLADDPDGAPFNPSASPVITYSALPAQVGIGHPIVVHGTLRNPVPGTPTLANKAVTLLSQPLVPANSPYVRTATATTDANGAFTLTYTSPSQHRRYRITSGSTSQIENSSLNPVFGDLLAAATVDTATVRVVAGIPSYSAVNDRKGHITVSGTLKPGTRGASAYILVYVRRAGTNEALRSLGLKPLSVGVSSFSFGYNIAAGNYDYVVRYGDGGYTDAVYTSSRTLRVT